MEKAKLPNGPYLIGTRYSKDRLRTLRALGFGVNETVMRRCAYCSCKVLIHRNSVNEWQDIEHVLICGPCGKAVAANDPNTIYGVTAESQRIYERAMLAIRSN